MNSKTFLLVENLLHIWKYLPVCLFLCLPRGMRSLFLWGVSVANTWWAPVFAYASPRQAEVRHII